MSEFKEDRNELLKCSKKTSYFTFENQVHLAKVVYCYDGDTCHCVFKHDGSYYRFKIRMDGYDTPERRPSKKNFPKEKDRKIIKEKAMKAKERLEELILDKIVVLECKGEDKYGRLLGVIRFCLNDDVSVNDMMVNEGYGYLYDGGTKDQSIFTKIKKVFKKNNKKKINRKTKQYKKLA